MVGSRFPLLRLTVLTSDTQACFIAARHSARFSLLLLAFCLFTSDYSVVDFAFWISAVTSATLRRS